MKNFIIVVISIRSCRSVDCVTLYFALLFNVRTVRCCAMADSTVVVVELQDNEMSQDASTPTARSAATTSKGTKSTAAKSAHPTYAAMIQQSLTAMKVS